MRVVLQIVLAIAVVASLNACSKFKRYNGPEVTKVIVAKSSRKMYLMHGESALKIYDVDLGFAPKGHKEIEGDGKTPEGSYVIDRRNPNSDFHLSLGINYPNAEDIAYAKKIGEEPGGDIFIHGGPKLFRDRNKKDWTFGCISVSNKEMEEVYSMILNGTPIDILP